MNDTKNPVLRVDGFTYSIEHDNTHHFFRAGSKEEALEMYNGMVENGYDKYPYFWDNVGLDNVHVVEVFEKPVSREEWLKLFNQPWRVILNETKEDGTKENGHGVCYKSFDTKEEADAFYESYKPYLVLKSVLPPEPNDGPASYVKRGA